MTSGRSKARNADWFEMITIKCKCGEIYFSELHQIGKKLICRKCKRLLDIENTVQPLAGKTATQEYEESRPGNHYNQTATKPKVTSFKKMSSALFWILATAIFILLSIFIFKRKAPLEISTPLQQNRNLNTLTSVPQGEPNSFWWIKDYSILIEKLCANPSCELKMSYFVRDNKQVFLSLKSNSNKSILLIADVPGESQGEIDASGKFVSGSGRYIYYIYDLNRDGSPDSFSEGPTLANQTSETDIVYQDRPDVVKTWEIGIGFAVNWQIHGIPSALPRN